MPTPLEKDLGLSANVNVAVSKKLSINESVFDKEGGQVGIDAPRGAYGVIMCGNKGGGYIPYRSLLVGQIYLKDLERDFEQYGFNEIYALPWRPHESILVAARSEEALEFAEKGQGAKQIEYRFTGTLREEVTRIAETSFTEEQLGVLVDEFMRNMEILTRDTIKAEIEKRDDQWEQKLQHVRMGLR